MIREFLLVVFVFMFACCELHAENLSADVFLGPSLGETIVIRHSNGGGITKKTCTFISDSGTYYIEERTRLPKKDTAPKGFPPEIAKMIMGEADIVNNYKLQAKDGKLVLESISFKGEENILVDFVDRRWAQFSRSPEGKVKTDYAIVKEGEEVILGKLRKVVRVKYSHDFDGLHYAQSYVLASGLGIIRRRNLSPGPNKIISILVEE
ncbi:hypothetical protein [Desulfovibrio sp. JC010]|uniref:hypothetical protein n=1 Tax=Desulfovibrio sp. JC010 TaxID=2593641 RepID=UPI0013D2875A|nr:hypothetical protein [Desulfovibrio sp. JC010]NDV25598.1 hypothetical protein [Desulfovibrio sp. JC010]